ncbi:MAG: mechanosensitive ion channel [Bacilli bacterium]|nr:mechanosensitive ion channel [Bacilli bacterium]
MLDKILTKEIVAPMVIIIGGLILSSVIRKIIKKTLYIKISKIDKKKNKTIVGLIDNIVKYFIFIVVVLMILDVYGIDTKTLIASLGVVGLALGLSLQDIIKDFLAGITIIFDNQYVVGDIVMIGDFKGEVISLGLKTTKIKAWTGEVKMIANHNISEVINYSSNNSLAIVDLPFSKSIDIEKVEKQLQDIIKDLNKTLENIAKPIDFLGINKITLASIEYRIIVETKPLCNFEVERKIKQIVQEKIKL